MMEPTRRAFGEQPTPKELAADLAESLDRAAEQYAGRADYQRRVRAIATTARDGIERYERSREDELRGATDALRAEIDRERKRADNAERERAAVEEIMARGPVKEIETGDSSNRLRFPKPPSPNGRSRRWTVSDFESVAYNIRLAGGQDDAWIDVHDQAFVAEVPFPEVVAGDRAARTQLSQEKPVVDLHAIAQEKRLARAVRYYRMAMFTMMLVFLYGGFSLLARAF